MDKCRVDALRYALATPISLTRSSSWSVSNELELSTTNNGSDVQIFQSVPGTDSVRSPIHTTTLTLIHQSTTERRLDFSRSSFYDVSDIAVVEFSPQHSTSFSLL